MSPKAHPGYRDDDAPEGVAPPSKAVKPVKPVKPVKRAEPVESIVEAIRREYSEFMASRLTPAERAWVQPSWKCQARDVGLSIWRDGANWWFVTEHGATPWDPGR